MHSGTAAGGDLLLTDPSQLPRQGSQAHLRAPLSPNIASIYSHDVPTALGAYQWPCFLARCSISAAPWLACL